MGKSSALGAVVLVLGLVACRPGSAVERKPSAAPSTAGSAGPVAGQCLTGAPASPFSPRYYRSEPTSCRRPHGEEVVTAGTLPDGPAPPAPGSGAYVTAYADCGRAVSRYVGGDWHDARLGIHVALPDTSSWAAGGRTAVCTAYAFEDVSTGLGSGRSDPLLGALAGRTNMTDFLDLQLHCVDVVSQPSSDGWYQTLNGLRAARCDEPHAGEYTGTVAVAGAARPTGDELATAMTAACRTSAAAFLGLAQAPFEQRTDIRVTWPGLSDDQWQAGEHTQRCFALVPYAGKVRTSLKGLGAGALPS